MTGTGTSGSGGTISATTQRGASFINASEIKLGYMNFTNAGTVDNVANNTGLSLGNNLGENAAIHLQNVTNVTLDHIAISGGAEEGINGNTVANFNLTNSTITGVGNAADEDGIHFYNMSGTSSIASTVISNSGDDNVNIQMQSGNLDLSVTGNGTVAGGSASGGVLGSGYLVGIRGTSTANLNFDSVIAQNNFSGGFVLDAYDTATMNVRVNNVQSFDNNDQIQVSISGAANADADITNSTFRSTTPTLDFVLMNLLGGSFSTGTLDARVANNTFNTQSGITADSVVVNQAGGGQMNVALTGNTINYSGTQRAVLVQAGTDGNGTLAATIQSNTIDMKNSGALANPAFLIQTAVTGPGNTSSIDLNMGGVGGLANTFLHSGGGTIAAGDIRVRQRNDGTLNLDGYVGGGQDTTAIANYLNGRNNEISPSTATVDGTTPHNYTGNATSNFIVVSVSATSVGEDGASNLVYTFTRLGNSSGALTANFAITGTATAGSDYTVSGATTFSNATGLGTVSFAAGVSTAQITVDPTADATAETDDSVVVDAGRGSFARALILNDDGLLFLKLAPSAEPTTNDTPAQSPSSDSEQQSSGRSASDGQAIYPTASSEATLATDTVRLTHAALGSLVDAAISRWADAGATPEQLAAMRAVDVDLVDMAGVFLGQSHAGSIALDSDGAGYGWFVDATPGDDAEFVAGKATDEGGAAGKLDLLSVIMHELGHQIGLGDDYNVSDAGTLMYGYLGVGERHAPTAAEVAAAGGDAVAGAYALSPVSVGTLPAGKAVDVYFTATVNTPPAGIITSPSGTATVSGTNFSNVTATSTFTLDTLVLSGTVFLDADNNNAFDTGELGLSGVTASLFIDNGTSAGVFDSGDTLVTSQSTNASGVYTFASLAPGNYIVRLDAANFTAPGGSLAGLENSPGGTDPDDNVDNDDNGLVSGTLGSGGFVVSQAITLSYNNEGPSYSSTAVPGNDTNTTLDFGFYQNSAPNGGNDTVTLAEDAGATDLTALVKLNDSDPDGDTLTITAATQGAHGTTSVVGGVLTYTPNANYNGGDSFTYTVSDGHGHTAQPTVTVTVTAVNDPVGTSGPGAATFLEDTGATIKSAGGNVPLAISDVDAALAPAGVYEVVLSSTHGVLTLTTLTGLTFTAGDGTADAAMTFHGTLSDINTALATATYTPDANYNGAAQIQIDAYDSFGGIVATGSGAGTHDGQAVNLTINSVNDAPSGADATITIGEDAPRTLTAADFGFGDTADGNALMAVKITTLPGAGTLSLNGSAVSAGTFVSATDIANNLLVYTPGANANGSGYASFTFQVQDNGGTANGGVDIDPSANTLSFNVTAVNDPVGTSGPGAATLLEDTGATIKSAGGNVPLAISDVDAALAPAGVYEVVLSSTHGVLTLTTLTGLTFTAGDGTADAAMTFHGTLSDINTALATATYTADANYNGAAQIQIDAYDSFGGIVATGSGAATHDGQAVNLTVTAVNDAPSGTDGTITIGEDAAYTFATTDFGFTDIDANTLQAVKFTTLPSAGALFYDADGAGGATPVVLSSGVTVSAADISQGKVTFVPAANAYGSGYASFTFQVQDDGGTANGGVDIDPSANTLSFNVTAANDPVTALAPSAISLAEDSVNYAVTGMSISDADAALAPAGVYEVTLGATHGSLTLTTTTGLSFTTGDGSADAVMTFHGTLADLNTALATAKYTPDANYNGFDAAGITLQAKDTFGGTVATGSGSATSDTKSINVTVTAANDSPVLVVPSPAAVAEQVSTYILSGASVSDVDLDAKNGGLGDYAGAVVSVNRNPSSNSVDDFELVAGTNFTINGINLQAGGQTFGHINADANGLISITFTSLETPATSALVDDVIQHLRYVYTGDNPPASVQLAVGFTDGSPGGGQGSGATGLDVKLLTVNITAVNDAPVNSLGGTIGTGEDAVQAWLSGMSISDPDAAAGTDTLRYTFNVAHGVLLLATNVAGGVTSAQVVGNNSGTITVIATLNQINATLAATNGLTYSPDANYNGSDTLTVTTNDLGHNGTDPGLTGDGTSEETVSTRTILISAVDDAPTPKNDAVSTAENVVGTGNVLLDNGSGPDTDIDGPLTVASVNGSAANVGTQITLASGAKLTLNADGSYSYDPNHAFDTLTSSTGGETGAVNTSATDSFTYTLTGGGGTATVTMTVNGVAGAGDWLRGDAGNNTVTGTPGADFFMLQQGGNDVALGGNGDDAFYFGAAFTAGDVVNGGAGMDQLGLQGDYSAGLALTGANMSDVEVLAILSGSDTRFGDPGTNLYDYNLTMADANVAAGQQLIVSANTLRAGEDLTFNGAAETDGSFLTYGGLGVDTITGGQQTDAFYFGLGGRFGAGDVLDGQGGMDQLGLQGDYTVHFGANQLHSVEVLVLMTASDARFAAPGEAFTYDVTMDDGNVAAGETMYVSANRLHAGEVLTFNGAAETNGSFIVFSGAANDTIVTGGGNDTIFGAGGADTMTGGGGNDIFAYVSETHSTAAARDTILDFTSGDVIDLSRIDALAGTAANDAFTAIGSAGFSGAAGELRYEHLSGNQWLVQADTDGIAGADFELLLQVTDGHTLGVGDFVL